MSPPESRAPTFGEARGAREISESGDSAPLRSPQDWGLRLRGIGKGPQDTPTPCPEAAADICSKLTWGFTRATG
eukprot:6240338-Pyramimonas_sp.AAC.1